MDYKNGKIYKITSSSIDKIYIGSTCQSLCKRHSKHKGYYKSYLQGKKNIASSVEIIKLGDSLITLIEDFPCERKEQLLSRERYWIEQNKDLVVNKIMPITSNEEKQEFQLIYRNTHKLEKKITDSNYRINNKEIIALRKKEYYEKNKEIIALQQKNYREKEKEKIKEYNSQQFNCECGSIIRLHDKSRHYKSKKHKDYLMKILI